MSDQSGTANVLWYTVEGAGDQWYVIDRRDSSQVCGCKYASIAATIVRDLNNGWDFQNALYRLVGVWPTK